MGQKNLSEIAKSLKDIDFMMLLTHTDGGQIAGRPMSNNRDVEYDGASWFFLDEESRTFADVSRDPSVALSAQGKGGLLGKPPVFFNIEGEAQIVRDRSTMEEHWVPDLERWWPQGLDSPGLAMIKVSASRIHYWDGEDQGELRL